jgi:hypothetical protein
MAKLKITANLRSSDLLGIPLELINEASWVGDGVGKMYSKFTTQTATGTPVALPATAFSSTDKRVLIYIRNTATDATQFVNLWVKSTVSASTLNGWDCCTGCSDFTQYIQIGEIPAGGFTVLPFAGNDYLYVDAAAGTPEIEYIIMEE